MSQDDAVPEVRRDRPSALPFMKIDLPAFRVPAGKPLALKDWKTDVGPLYASEDEYRETLDADVRELAGLQRLLAAANTHAVLLIFQATDVAGKDGAISHLLTGVNPAGCEVHGFRQPSAEELEHDFLWRTTRHLPPRGRIGVFNRSYYEEVIATRVHPDLLRHEGLPAELASAKTLWKGRYRSIVDLESHLHRNGTKVVKFFLHVSKEEQRRRFLARLDTPDKNWKFNPSDLAERASWNRYVKACEDCLPATSVRTAPWHVVPADDKRNARLIIARIVVEALRGLRLRYPTLTPARRNQLRALCQ